MGLLGFIAGGVVSELFRTYYAEMEGMTFNTLTEFIENTVSGKRTFDEWAELVSPNVDQVIMNNKESDNLIFAGGKIKFTFKDSSYLKIYIGYELYFANEEREWTKIEAKSEVFSSTFKNEELEMLKEKKEVSYEVTDVF